MERREAPAVIDCDLHNVVPSVQALFPYLSDYWVDTIRETAFKGAPANFYPANMPTSARPDAAPPDGGPPGSDLATLRAQALDTWGAEYGILNCAYAVESIHNPHAAEALARAVNDWQIAEWLDWEPRLRASIVVPSHHPDLAAREIERVGGHPGFVQVFLPVRAPAPYGNRRYYPIYEAAVRHGLVVGLHAGGASKLPPTPAGWPSYYSEEWTGMAAIFQSQLLSLVSEGVFDQFPALRVALIEGGWTWLPALLWRFDKEWKGLRREIPWVRRPPSAYIREHVRLTLQPLDAPPDPAHLLQIIDQLGSDELLLFSTDYPHWHFDRPEEALPAGLPDDLQRKILHDNARAFYNLA